MAFFPGMASPSLLCQRKNTTNTILACLPEHMVERRLEKATRAFSTFGKISDIHSIPQQHCGGSLNAVSVSFFDVRHAELAMQALGGEQYCRPGPQTGDRVVVLHADALLDEEDIKGVSNVFDDDVAGKSYKVEFFDFSVAERVRSASKPQEEEEVEPPPGLEHLMPSPPGLKQSKASQGPPVYIPDTKKVKMTSECHGLKDVTNMPTPERPQQAIMIQGLPNNLCNTMCFEAMLQQAGFQGSFVHFSTKPGKPCGEAIIWMNDFEGAQLCVAHFQGRSWSAGTTVRAWRVDADAVPSMKDPWSRQNSVRKRCDTSATEASTQCPTESEEDELSHGKSASSRSF